MRAWAAGKTNETTRDVPQLTLLGPVVYEGDRKTVAGTGLNRDANNEVLIASQIDMLERPDFLIASRDTGVP